MTPISVIIPTLGRPSLARVLEALRDQRDPPAFEIVVAIDGKPPTEFHVDASVHPRCSRLHTITLDTHQGVSAARNAAIAQADGEAFGFLDDDVVPQPDWIKTLARHFDGSESAAVTGRICEDGDRSTLAALRRIAFDNRHSANLRAGQAVDVDYLNGGNCGVRARPLREVGGFDPSYTKSQDRELARRLTHAGHYLRYAPDLVVTHAADYSVADLIRGRYRAGVSAGRMGAHGDRTSIGPITMQQTYGASLAGLAKQHGIRIAAASALSTAAHQLGRRTGASGHATQRATAHRPS